MKIVIENADFDDFNELAKLARQGKINTFCMTDEEDERPHGEWKHIVEEDNDVECPFCGFQEDGIYYNFCPKCGADMRGGGS